MTCEVTLTPGLPSLHSPAPSPICCLWNSHTCLRLPWQKPLPESTAREHLALAATIQSSPVSSAPAEDRGLWHPLCLRRAGKDGGAEPLYLHPSLTGKAGGGQVPGLDANSTNTPPTPNPRNPAHTVRKHKESLPRRQRTSIPPHTHPSLVCFLSSICDRYKFLATRDKLQVFHV